MHFGVVVNADFLMIRIALRVAAFACGLGIAWPCWAQTTPVSQFPPSQTVDWPLHTIGGAIRLYDINGNVIGGAAHPVMVQCPDGTVNCFGAGTAGFTQTDEAAYTAGVSAFGPGGGLFQTSATSNALTNGQIGAFQVTATRALFTNLRNASGTEIGTASAPVQVSVANTAANSTPLNVTANAGTNLNTSSLALETGGNLATIANSLGGCAGQPLANTSFTPFDNNGSATTLKLVSKVSTKKVYVCGVKIGPTAAAVNVALIEGTKTTNECDTGAKGLLNGASAGRGDQLPINGSYTFGNGQGVIAVTPDANNDVCIAFSGTAQTGGQIIWAQF